MLSQILPLAYLTLGVHAGGCEVNPCMNGGQCYDIGENGYECICNSYAGKNCQIPPPAVHCESSRIKIDLDRSWLMEKVRTDNWRNIYMGQGQSDHSGCRALVTSDEPDLVTLTLDRNFRQCGTHVTRNEDGNYVYQNTIFMNLAQNGIQTGLAALVQWSCEYEDTYTVSYEGGLTPEGKPRDDRAKARGIIGDYELNLRSYVKPTFSTDNLLTSFITAGSDQTFHVLPSDKKWVSFQVALTGEAQMNEAKVSLRKCFISSSRSPFNHQVADIIELVHDGCPTKEGATHVYSHGVAATAEFATNIRKFKAPWMESNPFYFHCETQLCPVGEVCPTGCGASEQVEDPLKVHVTSGPYFFQGSRALVSRTAQLEGEDAEHSYDFGHLMGEAEAELELLEETVARDTPSEKETLPLVGAMAIISLLAILVISGIVTIFNRRAARKSNESKRTANHVDINFAHEGSLRATQNSAGYTSVVASGRHLHLPGSRPAGLRPNYV